MKFNEYINGRKQQSAWKSINNIWVFDIMGIDHEESVLSQNAFTPGSWSNTCKQFVLNMFDKLFEYVWPLCDIGV